MFGIGKNKQAQTDNQVPYQVYETLQQPTDRRRLWIIRLVVSLAIVTILILGGVGLSRWLLGNDNESDQSTATNSAEQSEGNSGGNPAGDRRGNAPQATGDDRAPDQSGQAPATPTPQPPAEIGQSPQQSGNLPSTGSGPEPADGPSGNNTTTVRKPE